MDQAVTEWRVSAAGRIGTAVAAASFMASGPVLLYALSADGLGLHALDVVIATLMSLVAVPTLVVAFRPRIRLTSQAVVVTNPLRRYTVELADITDAKASWDGVCIDTDRETVIAWAVQKSNLSRWLGRQTRADRVAAAIRHAAGIT